MRKIYAIAASVFLFSCNNEKATEQKEEIKAPASAVVLPNKMAYQGTASIGKAENIAIIMNFNNDFVAGKLDNIGSYLADSVHLVLEDGVDVNTVRDSIVAMIKTWRESMTDAKVSYISAMAVDVKDKGHEWVFQWIDETHNYKDGKKEQRIYHEDYRLENGKIREAYQYGQGVPVKK